VDKAWRRYMNVVECIFFCPILAAPLIFEAFTREAFRFLCQLAGFFWYINVSFGSKGRRGESCTVKKVTDYPVPRQDVSGQTLPDGE
jgi:hypothetical protein